jgi:hypothetical protein
MGGTTSSVTVRAPKARHGRHEVRLLWALHDPFVNRHAGEHGVARDAVLPVARTPASRAC